MNKNLQSQIRIFNSGSSKIAKSIFACIALTKNEDTSFQCEFVKHVNVLDCNTGTNLQYRNSACTCYEF